MSAVRMRWPKAFPLVTSFVGAMDLKLGVSIITLFAVLNKVAGAYGMIAVFTGAKAAQLTLYLYSLGTIAVFVWGLKKIGEENGPKTFLYAHLFAFDHLIGTIFTSFFAVVWYAYVPHDGRRTANSEAQKEMMGDPAPGNGIGHGLSDEARKAAAEAIWKSERGFSAAVLVLGWMIKIYFIICVYSFALHLRRGTYYTLPLSKPLSSAGFANNQSRSMSNGDRGRYSHVRGSSSSAAGLGRSSMDTDIDSTLAETLWEEGEDSNMLNTFNSSSAAERRSSTPARLESPTAANGNSGLGGISGREKDAEDSVVSPAMAKGTGMIRSHSVGAGVSQRERESSSAPSGQGVANGTNGLNTPDNRENAFARILGRMSMDATR